MAVTIPSIPRVYLRQELAYLKHSGHHTIWAPAPTQPAGDPRQPQALVSLTLYNGIAEDVPVQTYELFKDLGYVTTDAPTAWWQTQRR
jgi:hypothetical protein